jgi:hypothetical protein
MTRTAPPPRRLSQGHFTWGITSVLFYLGTHEPSWLGQTDVPLFLSRRRLAPLRRPRRAAGSWALDSGGFSELCASGRWSVSPQQYAHEARRWQDEIGSLAWAAIMDWMCEPFILAKTGLSIEAHQWLTVASWLTLRGLAPEVPWVPVVQGWRAGDYLRHVEMYAAVGTDLAALPLVGLGSVCRRQATREAAGIVAALYARGLRLHLFGFKIDGLRNCGAFAVSCDSMAWSATARRDRIRLPGCRHSNCANCRRWALRWREKVLRAAADGCRCAQPVLL